MFPNAPEWITWLLITAAVCTALGVIWRFALHPAVRFLSDADDYGSVIRAIAKEFKSNGGSTLKDQMNVLVAGVAELKISATENKAIAKRAEAAAVAAHAEIQVLTRQLHVVVVQKHPPS